MQLDQARNARVLASLSAHAAGQAPLVRHDAVAPADAHLRRGCHPDVVERLWDQINPALPTDCRWLVHGTPALVHPGGLILAIGMGTSYGLRLLPSHATEAAAAGARTVTTPAGGPPIDIRATHGGDWVVGAWLSQEPAWCAAVCAAASGAEHLLMTPGGDEPVLPDPAAVVAEERRAARADLEHRASTGDPEAMFSLAQWLMNAAMRERSWALFDRAEALLSQAARSGHAQAAGMAAAWPHLRAQAQRTFPPADAP